MRWMLKSLLLEAPRMKGTEKRGRSNTIINPSYPRALNRVTNHMVQDHGQGVHRLLLPLPGQVMRCCSQTRSYPCSRRER